MHDNFFCEAKMTPHPDGDAMPVQEIEKFREIWRQREGDYYADSISASEAGNIRIDCGGYVSTRTIREWHKLAWDYSIGLDDGWSIQYEPETRFIALTHPNGGKQSVCECSPEWAERIISALKGDNFRDLVQEVMSASSTPENADLPQKAKRLIELPHALAETDWFKRADNALRSRADSPQPQIDDKKWAEVEEEACHAAMFTDDQPQTGDFRALVQEVINISSPHFGAEGAKKLIELPHAMAEAGWFKRAENALSKSIFPTGTRPEIHMTLNGDIVIGDANDEDAPLITIKGHNGTDVKSFMDNLALQDFACRISSIIWGGELGWTRENGLKDLSDEVKKRGLGNAQNYEPSAPPYGESGEEAKGKGGESPQGFASPPQDVNDINVADIPQPTEKQGNHTQDGRGLADELYHAASDFHTTVNNPKASWETLCDRSERLNKALARYEAGRSK